MKKAKKKGPAPKGRRSAAPTKAPTIPKGWVRVETGYVMRKGDRVCWPAIGPDFEDVMGLDGCKVSSTELVIREAPPPKSPKGRGK